MEGLLWSIPPSWTGFWWVDRPVARFFWEHKTVPKYLGKWFIILIYIKTNSTLSLKWFKIITIKSPHHVSSISKLGCCHMNFSGHRVHQLGNFNTSTILPLCFASRYESRARHLQPWPSHLHEPRWELPRKLLLMAEIRRSPVEVGSCFSHYLQGFINPRWCRISTINSMFPSSMMFKMWSKVRVWTFHFFPFRQCQCFLLLQASQLGCWGGDSSLFSPNTTCWFGRCWANSLKK